MKKSELKSLIKEEIQKVLQEADMDKLHKFLDAQSIISQQHIDELERMGAHGKLRSTDPKDNWLQIQEEFKVFMGM